MTGRGIFVRERLESVYMRRFILLILGLIACASYWFVLRRAFAVEFVKPSQFQTTLLPSNVIEVHEKDPLHWLILLDNGSAEIVDLSKGVMLLPIIQANPFRVSSLTQSGIAYFLDDRKALYRWKPGMKVARSKPLKVPGIIVGMAVEESSRVLWCLERRDEPEPNGLFIDAISMENGKSLGTVNVGPHRGHPAVFCTHNGGGIVVTVQDDPTAFHFSVKDKVIVSHSYQLDDLVNSVVFDGESMFLGLRNGVAQKYSLSDDKLLATFESDFLPVTQLKVSKEFLEVAHGDADQRGGIGSLAFFSLKDCKLIHQSGTKDRIDGLAGSFSDGGLLAGTRSGQLIWQEKPDHLKQVSIDHHRIQNIQWMNGEHGVYGVIDGNKLIRLEIP